MIIIKELLTLQRDLTTEFFLMVSSCSTFKMWNRLRKLSLCASEIQLVIFTTHSSLQQCRVCAPQMCLLLPNWEFLWVLFLFVCLFVAVVLEFHWPFFPRSPCFFCLSVKLAQIWAIISGCWVSRPIRGWTSDWGGRMLCVRAGTRTLYKQM